MYNEISVKRYCKDEPELIENYQQAKYDIWNTYVLHHRLELTIDGDFALSADDLKRLGMYYQRPHYELVFMKLSEHQKLHNNKKIMDQECRCKKRKKCSCFKLPE